MRYVLKFLQFFPEKIMEEVKKNLADGEDEPSNVAQAFDLELEDTDNTEEIKKRAEKMRQEIGYDAVKIFRELE